MTDTRLKHFGVQGSLPKKQTACSPKILLLLNLPYKANAIISNKKISAMKEIYHTSLVPVL